MATDYQSGVVMIQTIKYYELVLGNGESLYFNESDFDKNAGEFLSLSTELETHDPDIFYGTGFFISDNGKIATNRHVIEGNVTETEAKMGIGKILGTLEDNLEKLKEEYTHYISDMKGFIILDTKKLDSIKRSGGSQADMEATIHAIQANTEALEYFTQQLELIDMLLKQLKQADPMNATLFPYNEVRVGFNNTFIKRIDELKLCEIRSKSETDDLAIIQLNTKQTPKNRHVFELTPRDMIQHYSFGEFLMHLIGKDKNETLMMMGYNYGPEGGITKEGLIAQHTQGSLIRYMKNSREFEYDIPALTGSSGSPILNRRGQIVGINYARIDTTTNNINCGVKEKYLYELNKNL